MAKIKLGGLAQDVRGSLNGTTFSRNKGGAYVRTRVSPVQPRTPAQLRQRNIFAVNSKAWSALTQLERDAWTAFALANPLTNVFGDSIVISGLAAYQQLNAVLRTIGAAAESSPPADKTVTPIPAVLSLAGVSAGDGTVASLTMSTGAQSAPATTKYYVFATPGLQAGITPTKSSFRFIGGIPTVAAAVTSALEDNWNSVFAGSAITGKNISIIVAQVNINTGAVTVGQKFMATLT